MTDIGKMTPSESVDELMLRWENARHQGRVLTVEELCAECLQHSDELRRRIHAVQAMERVFGVSNDQTMPGSGEPEPIDSDPEYWPRIPGYEILRVIDQGGMGVVYEARQIELGRTVAIKMISGVRLRPKTVARFRAEAEAAARLQHPNFVQIFEVGQINGRPFFSMEYVAGGSLAEMLARGRPTPTRAAELIETLARAVHAAHDRNIVHRDLKPSNVMLMADGTPKIADFGLAKRLDDDSGHTHTGEILGTPSYMAPEQAEGKKDQIGPRTDVYALGAILYELLTGKPPFQGASPLDSLRLVVNQEATAPSKLAAAVPRDLDAICLKCLEKSPEQRYPSALALADDLHRFLAGEPIIARHVGPVQRAWKAMRRHPQWVALATVCALIPIAFLVLYLLNERQLRLDAEDKAHKIKLKAEEQAPLVREILARNCYECHGQDPQDVKRDLNILNHQQLLDGSRKIVVPGSPDDSRLMKRIADGSMPPEEEEERLPRLSQQELEILRDWILGGAPPLPIPDPAHPPPTAVPYSELAAQVKQVFKENCYDCHSHEIAKGGIKILHHRLLVSVHKVVVPGHPEQSELYDLITRPDTAKLCMPPKTFEGKTYERLPREDVDLIRRWILEGAPPFPKEKDAK